MKYAPSVWLILCLGVLHGQEIEFFESKIRPALSNYCYECHSEESGKSKGGLRVDSSEAMLRGGETGPAMDPGKTGESLFLRAIRYQDPDLAMPPKQKLPDSVIADFETWIARGTPDPRKSANPVAVKTGIDVNAGRNFWSFRGPAPQEVPTPKNSEWARSDIDRFVLEKLEEHDLTPSDDAAPATLVRRLYFVLSGLPPAPLDIQRWTGEIGPELNQEAVASLVDQLLSSSAYGERWGRHWLDVARYADSSGGDSNNIYPHAWRYRDYVIGAFNADKPFDDFIREQIAGDLLPIGNDREWADNLVATGFLATGQKLVGEVEDRKFFSDLVDEQIDATTRAFLGINVACARCHDHKSDPIPQADYYALAAIFRNTETHYGLMKAQARQFSTLIDVTGMGLPVGRKKLSKAEFAELQLAREEATRNMNDLMSRIRGSGETVTRANLRRSRTQRDRAETALQSYDVEGNPLSFAMGVQDRGERLETRLLVRGELDKPGQLVSAGYLQVISPSGKHQLPQGYQGSGRRYLAEWIASPGNPLTARVIANRIWHWMFGRGIIRSTDDFGATGGEPSHPELLDYLALKMIENHWSIKQLVREIALSKTWQQASTFERRKFESDPENRYAWRAEPRRLEAEAIRDSLLFVAGNLKPGRPEFSIIDGVGEGTVGQSVFEPEIRKLEASFRSVYLPRVRNVLPEALELFDAPDAGNVSGTRDTTIVPLQALYSMNSEFMYRQAEGFARRIAEMPPSQQLGYAHLAAFGRLPLEKERRLAADFVATLQSEETGPSDEVRKKAMAAYCHALLCAGEFSVID